MLNHYTSQPLQPFLLVFFSLQHTHTHNIVFSLHLLFNLTIFLFHLFCFCFFHGLCFFSSLHSFVCDHSDFTLWHSATFTNTPELVHIISCHGYFSFTRSYFLFSLEHNLAFIRTLAHSHSIVLRSQEWHRKRKTYKR